MSRGEVNVITTWPGCYLEQSKAPTELFYENGDVKWGFEVACDCDSFRWFKLLLLKDEDLGDEFVASESIIRARQMLEQANKTAEDLVADYLRSLWAWTLKSICDAVSLTSNAYVFQGSRRS